MNERQRSSSRPAFEKAADSPEGWRQHQIVALTDDQRRQYDQARREAAQREKEKKQELERRREADIKERTRQRLLAKQRFDKAVPGKGAKMTEELAKRLVDQYFPAKNPPRDNLYAQHVRQAEQQARGEIAHEHARERDAVHRKERDKLDSLLKSFERSRTTRADFTRAGLPAKARTDFQKSARDRAIDDAINNTKNKHDNEKNGPGDGRGR